MNEKFLPIPSLNNLYEISPKGVVIRSSDKKKLVPYFSFPIGNGKRTSRTLTSLLFEVYGQKPKTFHNYLPIQCYVTDGEKHYHFQTLRDCAKFLAPKLHYAQKTVEHWLYMHRKKEIGEYKIKYLGRVKFKTEQYGKKKKYNKKG